MYLRAKSVIRKERDYERQGCSSHLAEICSTFIMTFVWKFYCVNILSCDYNFRNVSCTYSLF